MTTHASSDSSSCSANDYSVSAEASGRLDLLGAAAEFGGTLALHVPTRARCRVQIRKLEQDGMRFSGHQGLPWRMEGKQLKALLENRISDNSLVKVLREDRYSEDFITQLTCLKLVVRASGCGLPHGIEISVDSEIPPRRGFSHRPALLIASLRAYGKLLHYRFPGQELAQWSATVESLIWQANASLADHLTCAYAEAGKIQPILCRPDLMLPAIPLPETTTVAGVAIGDSYHSDNPAYLRTRTAAFIGKYLLERKLDRQFTYISQIAFAYLTHPAYTNLPHTLKGSAFPPGLEALDDPYCQLLPDTLYPVREALSYPILEKRRAERFLELLLNPHSSPRLTHDLGTLLFQSHRASQNVGLTDPLADKLVDRLRRGKKDNGLFGARSSAHGQSAAVVVLLQKDALHDLQPITSATLPADPLILTAS